MTKEQLEELVPDVKTYFVDDVLCPFCTETMCLFEDVQRQTEQLRDAVELLKASRMIMANPKADFLIASKCHEIDAFLKSFKEIK
jgi:hypothetical protein